MRLHTKTCYLCHASDARLFERTRVDGEELTNWVCTECGLVWLSPRLDSDEVAEFYSKHYYSTLFPGTSSPTDVSIKKSRSRSEALTSAIVQHLHGAPIARHLDIGSGSGQLLNAMVRTLGIVSVGVEPGNEYREYSQRDGHRVYGALSDLDTHAEPPFDLVTISHVLEHLDDPISVLRTLSERWLRPSGFLIIEVPNLFGHPCFEVGHNYSFSADTLARVIQAGGLSVQSIEVHGRPVDARSPLYILAAAQNAPVPRQSIPRGGKPNIAHMFLKRRAGIIRALPPSQKLRGVASFAKHLLRR